MPKVPFASKRLFGLVSAALALLPLGGAVAAAQDVNVTMAGQQIVVSRSETALLAPHIERALQRKQVFPTVADPSISELAAGALNQVVFEVSKDGEAIGKARLAWPLGRSAVDVVLKGPITSKGAGTPFTQAGLSSGASVRLGLQHTIWATTSAVSEITAIAANQNISHVEAASALLAAARRNNQTFRASATPQSSPGLRRLAAADLGDTEAQAAAALVEAGLTNVDSSFFAAVGYETSSQSFEFLEGATLSRQTVRRRGDGVSFSLGYGRTGTFEGTPAKQPLAYIGLAFTGATGATGSPEQQVCQPLEGSANATTCETIALGGPVSAKTRALKVEARQWMRDQRIGLNPVFVRDLEAKTSSLEMNISALVFKKGAEGKPTYELDSSALTAGVRIGWKFEGKAEGAYFAIFFGTVLGAW